MHYKILFKDTNKEYRVVVAEFQHSQNANKAMAKIKKKYPTYTNFRVFKVK